MIWVFPIKAYICVIIIIGLLPCIYLIRFDNSCNSQFSARFLKFTFLQKNRYFLNWFKSIRQLIFTSIFFRHVAKAFLESSCCFAFLSLYFLYAISIKIKNIPITIPPATNIKTPKKMPKYKQKLKSSIVLHNQFYQPCWWHPECLAKNLFYHKNYSTLKSTSSPNLP